MYMYTSWLSAHHSSCCRVRSVMLWGVSRPDMWHTTSVSPVDPSEWPSCNEQRHQGTLSQCWRDLYAYIQHNCTCTRTHVNVTDNANIHSILWMFTSHSKEISCEYHVTVFSYTIIWHATGRQDYQYKVYYWLAYTQILITNVNCLFN